MRNGRQAVQFWPASSFHCAVAASHFATTPTGGLVLVGSTRAGLRTTPGGNAGWGGGGALHVMVLRPRVLRRPALSPALLFSTIPAFTTAVWFPESCGTAYTLVPSSETASA